MVDAVVIRVVYLLGATIGVTHCYEDTVPEVKAFFSRVLAFGAFHSVELPVTIDPVAEFLEVPCTGLLANTSERSHIDLIV